MEEILTELNREVQAGGAEKVKQLVQKALDQGVSAIDVLEKGLRSAMEEVGRKFEALEIFLPEMMSAAEARRISRGVLWINIPLYLVVVVIGMMAVGLFGGKDLEGDHVMTRILLGYVPPIFAGIAFAGLLAAVMSTMDTAINTGSLVLTEDFYHRLINPKASERSILIFARIAATIMALLGILVAVLIRDLLWVLWMASDILAAGVFWPLILGMYTKWVTNAGAIASMLAGSLHVLWQYLIGLGVGLPSIIPAWPGRSWPFSIFWGILIGFVVFTVVSLLTRTAKERERADRFFANLKEAKG